MRIALIRHGETGGNRERRYIGSTDEPLCDDGRRALRAAVTGGFYPKTEAVFSSPMQRCRETAALLYPGYAVCTERDFRERDFGRFERKTAEEASRDAAYAAWLESGGRKPFPDGEPEEAVRTRVLAAFDGICRRVRRMEPLSSAGETAVCAALVVHGGTIMTILSERLTEERGGFYDYQCGCGDYFLVELLEKSMLLCGRYRLEEAVRDV